METADEIVWNGDAEERFAERVIEREIHSLGSGKNLLDEVTEAVKSAQRNLNQYQERPNTNDRVIPLSKSKHVLVYQKVGLPNGKRRLLILDVRKSY